MPASRALSLLAVVLGASLSAGAACAEERAAEPKAPAQAERPEATAADRAALLERANAYWKARVARDRSVVDFYPPADKRLAHGAIPENGAVRFESFEIEGVEIEGEVATVTVKVDSRIDGRTPFPIPEHVNRRTLRERWDRIDGVWYKQAVVPALRAASADLQRAFERRRAERAAAEEAAKAKDAGSGALSEGAGAEPEVDSDP
jgi:hypothetical protein